MRRDRAKPPGALMWLRGASALHRSNAIRAFMLRCGVAYVEKSLVLRSLESASWGGRSRRSSNARRVFYVHGWTVCRQRRSSCRHLPWMDGMPTTQEQLPAFAMDGRYTDNAGRLHGCRRYASMDGCGRTASGTAVESNAGAVAEELPVYGAMATSASATGPSSTVSRIGSSSLRKRNWPSARSSPGSPLEDAMTSVGSESRSAASVAK